MSRPAQPTLALRMKALALLVFVAVLSPTGCGQPPPEASVPRPAQLAPAELATAGVSGPLPPEVAALPREPPAPRQQIAPVHLPASEGEVLDNGVRVSLTPLAGEPLVRLVLRVGAGGLDDRPGVASLTAAMVTSGAAAEVARVDRAKRALHRLGAELDVRVTATSSEWAITVARDDAAAGVTALAALIAQPSLRQRGFAEARERAMTLASARSRDDADWLVAELMQRTLSGGQATSRQARHGTVSELSRIRFSHVDDYYRAHYVAAKLEISAAGDVELDALVAAAKASLGKRPKRAVGPAAELDWQGDTRLEVLFVEQPGAAEALVAVGAHADLPETPAGTASWWWLAGGQDVAITHADRLQVVFSRRTSGAIVDTVASLIEQLMSHAPTEPDRARALLQLAHERTQPDELLRAKLATAHWGPDAAAALVRLELADAQRVLSRLSPPKALVVVGDRSMADALTDFGTVKVVDPRSGFSVVETISD